MPEDVFLEGLEEGAAEETAEEGAGIAGAEDEDGGAGGEPAAKPAGSEPAAQGEPAEPEADAEPAAEPAAPPVAGAGTAPAAPKPPEISWLEQQARERGLSVPALIEQLDKDSAAARQAARQEQIQGTAAKVFADLQAQYPNSAEDKLLHALAMELAEKAVRGQEDAAEKERVERERLAQAEREKAGQAMREPWERYFLKFPNADAKNLPVELLLKVKAGLSPVEAQMELEIENLKSQAVREVQKQANQQKAVGSLKGAGKEGMSDPFLEGLNS